MSATLDSRLIDNGESTLAQHHLFLYISHPKRNRMRSPRTDYHARAGVAELGLLAVVVLELVGFVIDHDHRLGGRLRLLLLHLHLLIIDEVDLEAHGGGVTEGRVDADVTVSLCMFRKTWV